MGKGSRLRRKNSSSSMEPCNDKDEKKILQPCKRCEDEMFKLRDLNGRLIKDINTARQDLKACFSHKVEEMESQIHILQAASTNLESKIDNQFLQEVKIGEQFSDQLMEIDKEFRQQLAKRDEEYDAGISNAWHQLQEAEERFARHISEKENNCRAVFSDKQTLESSVLQLTDKIKIISGEFEAARKAWELEKNGLFLQIASARKETEEMAESRLIAEQAWNTDKENLLSSLGRTYEKKIEDICALNQRALCEKTELESQLNESKERTRELLEKLEDDRHLWDSEKQELQGNAEELQTKIDSMATEGGLLFQKNTALSAEVGSLKTQLNENIMSMAQMQDERVQNEGVLQQYRTKNVDLQSSLNDSEAKTQDLLRKIEEDTHLWDAEKNNLESQLNESKQRTRELLEKLEDDRHLWESEKQELHCNAAELQAKIDSMATEGGLLCQENRSLSAEVESLKAQLNEKITRIVGMQDERVQNERVLQQYIAKNVDLQSSLNDSKSKTRDLLRKIEDDTHLWDAEKNNLESQLNESKERTRELLENLEYERHLGDSEKQKLKDNAEDLQTKIDSIATEGELLCQKNRALSAEVDFLKTQLNENITRIAQMQDEKVQNERALQQYRTETVGLQSSLNDSKAKTQDLLRKIEQDTHLWDAEKHNLEGVVSDIQGQLSVMAEEKKRQLESLEDQLSSIAEGKKILEVENKSLQTELDRRTLVAEEEKVILEGRVRELQITFNSLDKELESSRANAWEKDRLFVDLQNRHSEVVEAKRCLENKNESLLTEIDRCRMVSEENIRLQKTVGELEMAVESLKKKDIETKDNRLQKLMSERQPPSRIPVVPGAKFGTPKGNVSLNETPISKSNEKEESTVTPEKRAVRKPLVPKRNGALNENPKPNGGGGVLHENHQKSMLITPEKRTTTTLQKPVVPKRNGAANVNPKPNAGVGVGVVVHENEKPMVTPEKLTTLQKREAGQPKAVAQRRSPNVARAPQNPKSTPFSVKSST